MFSFFSFSFLFMRAVFVAVSRDAVAIFGDTATFSPVAATVSAHPLFSLPAADNNPDRYGDDCDVW